MFRDELPLSRRSYNVHLHVYVTAEGLQYLDPFLRNF
eukprot:jgi/Botrbrau1/16693/Bobra.0267s0009.1